MKLNRAFLILGLLLMTAFFLQDVFNLRWNWLLELQSDEAYKRFSGLFLAAYIAEQWCLSLARIGEAQKRLRLIYKIHQEFGVFAPVFFYIHSMRIGYAYLCFLSLIFFSNILIGLLNPASLDIRNKKVSYYWMVSHVSLAVLTVILMFFHIFIVFYYE
jgi:methionine sulfoxide reductase heme-binding subunit